jgi:hypothetical protein
MDLAPGYTGSWGHVDPSAPLPPSYLLTPPLKRSYWYQGRTYVDPLPDGRASAQAPPHRPLTTGPIAGTTSNGFVQAEGYLLALLLLYAWRRVSRRAAAGK